MGLTNNPVAITVSISWVLRILSNAGDPARLNIRGLGNVPSIGHSWPGSIPVGKGEHPPVPHGPQYKIAWNECLLNSREIDLILKRRAPACRADRIRENLSRVNWEQ